MKWITRERVYDERKERPTHDSRIIFMKWITRERVYDALYAYCQEMIRRTSPMAILSRNEGKGYKGNATCVEVILADLTR